MDQVQPLVQYLETHGWVSPEQAEILRESISRDELVGSLHDSGLLNTQEIERLESLFAALPRYRGQLEQSSIEDQRVVPYHLAQQYRIACVGSNEQGIQLVTDRALLAPEAMQSLGMQIASVYRIEREAMDRVLERYRTHIVSEIDASIERTAQVVRRVESYGSRSMAFLFPQDHKREIAEDISTLKLMRKLVERAGIDGADMLIIRPGANKVSVELSRAGETRHYTVLPKSTEGPLYLKLRYLADLSLEECTRSHTATVQGIGRSARETFLVDFIPQSNGVTMIVRSQQESPDRLVLAQAGLGEQDITTLTQVINRAQGIVGITGLSGSGKTFASYHLIEAAAHTHQCMTLESSIEYIVDGVDQTTYSKRPDKDIRDIPPYYRVVGLLPGRSDSLQAIYNLAQSKLVVLDFQEGILAAVKQLVRMGVSAADISRVMQYNLVSYRYSMIDAQTRSTYKLSNDEIATLEEYCSRTELETLMHQEGVCETPVRSWTDVTWYEKAAGNSLWWNTRARAQHALADDSSYRYVRAVVALGDVIHEAHKQNLSLVDTDYQIQYAQKRAIVRRSLVAAARGEIAIRDVIAMLRA